MSGGKQPAAVDEMLTWLLSPEVKAVNPKMDMRFSYDHVVALLSEIVALRSRAALAGDEQ